MKFVWSVLFLVFLPRPKERGVRGKMILIVVEAIPAGIKPPGANDSMRTFMGGKCDFDASVPLLTRASPMHFLGTKGGSAIFPKLVKLVGPSSIQVEELSPCFAEICCSAPRTLASLRVWVYVCLRGKT